MTLYGEELTKYEVNIMKTGYIIKITFTDEPYEGDTYFITKRQFVADPEQVRMSNSDAYTTKYTCQKACDRLQDYSDRYCKRLNQPHAEFTPHKVQYYTA